MAQGKTSVVMDSDDFAKGMSTSSNLTDGGFSPESVGINLIPNPGVIYPAVAPDSPATALDGRVIAHCADVYQTNSAIVDRYVLTNNGSLYTYKNASNVLTKLSTGISNTVSVVGACDIIAYGRDGSTRPVVWVSSLADTINGIYYDYNNGSSGSFGTYFGSLTSNPHPFVIFNKTLFMADGNKLHSLLYNSPGSFTTTLAVLTLNPDEIITALSIDPSTGRMLLGIAGRGSLTALGDQSVKTYNPSYIGLYDGINPTQLLRKIPVDSTVTSFFVCGGGVYVAYGDCLGQFNGTGIIFLRKLNNIANGSNAIMYKHKLTNINNILFYANSAQTNPFLNTASSDVVGYGEIKGGQKAFYNYINFPGSGSNIDAIFNVAGNSIVYATFDGASTYKLYRISYTDKSSTVQTGDNSPIFVTSRISFPRPSTVNQIRILFEDPVTNDGTVIGNLALVGDTRTITYNLNISNPSTSAGATTWFDIFPDDVITTECQIKYQFKETNNAHGIQKFMLWYTPNE